MGTFSSQQKCRHYSPFACRRMASRQYSPLRCICKIIKQRTKCVRYSNDFCSDNDLWNCYMRLNSNLLYRFLAWPSLRGTITKGSRTDMPHFIECNNALRFWINYIGSRSPCKYFKNVHNIRKQHEAVSLKGKMYLGLKS